jgi:hypothetical protein
MFNIINIKRPRSLILLKINALNAALSVLIFVDQKLIRKNDVSPISSHPKNKTNKFPPKTSMHILIINKLINKNNLSTCGSYRKYENVYINTAKPMDKISVTYVMDNLSTRISKFTWIVPGK